MGENFCLFFCIEIYFHHDSKAHHILYAIINMRGTLWGSFSPMRAGGETGITSPDKNFFYLSIFINIMLTNLLFKSIAYIVIFHIVA